VSHPDFVFRPYQGEINHSQIRSIRVACRGGIDPCSVVEPFPTLGEVARTAAAAAQRDQLIVEHNGSAVSYAMITAWLDQDGTEVYLHRGWLLPELQGRGVGTAMIGWAEDRIAELVDRPDRACFAANAADVEPASVALLTDLGYRRVFSVIEFERPRLDDLLTDDIALPDGIELRPVATVHYRPVWEMIRSAYADTDNVGGWDFDAFARAAEPAHWQVAWADDQVVAVALCVAGPDHVGEVRELSVPKDRRHGGLGRILLLRGLQSLARHGDCSARLFTGSANPYRSYDLYQSAGFRRVAEFGRYRKPFQRK
jgi:ribosomal protein S18 acetylase RimI-like enzyme